MKRQVLALVTLGAIGILSLAPVVSAQASDPTLDLYFSPPFVQGSEVTGGNSESFNSMTAGAEGNTNCATSWGGVGSATGDCQVRSWNGAGGAAVSPTDPTPTVNAAGSNYPSTQWTGGVSLKAINVTFASPVKYVGFWWSAGNASNGTSYTNVVDFYSGATKVATMTADDVTDILGTLPNPYTSGGSITSGSGATYPKAYYFGDPLGYSTTTPTSSPTLPGSWSPQAPFVYLNLFVDGDYSIDRMVISGDGFEFDNVVTSTSSQVPSGNLFLAKTITVTPPPGPSPDNGGGSGLPDTGIAVLTFTVIALFGVFLFLLAGGAFNSRTRLRLFGVDVEVREKLDRLSQSLTRMERKRPRIRTRNDI